MGEIAILFGIACAAVLVIAALCRSAHAFMLALVLSTAWGVTKLFPMTYASAGGIMLDASCKVAIAAVGLYVMHCRRRLVWPRIIVSSQILAALFVVMWAAAHNMGFSWPTYPYAVAMNVLYLVVILSTLSLGLHDGAILLRSWMSVHHYGRPWSRPGVKWGREAVHPSPRKAKCE